MDTVRSCPSSYNRTWAHYALVHCIPWLQLHDVVIRFVPDTVCFDSPYWLDVPVPPV